MALLLLLLLSSLLKDILDSTNPSPCSQSPWPHAISNPWSLFFLSVSQFLFLRHCSPLRFVPSFPTQLSTYISRPFSPPLQKVNVSVNLGPSLSPQSSSSLCPLTRPDSQRCTRGFFCLGVRGIRRNWLERDWKTVGVRQKAVVVEIENIIRCVGAGDETSKPTQEKKKGEKKIREGWINFP